jgi:hypothetical protein
MEHGRLAGNTSINDRIQACLAALDPRDVPAFLRKFRCDGDDQKFHTFRELILGAHLREGGWAARYEQAVTGKTPDWLIPAEAEGPVEIVDVVTLHQRRSTDIEIGASFCAGRAWAGWVTIRPDHILSKLDQKVGSYRRLASLRNLPYTVAAFSEFTASLDPEEVSHVLYEHHGGLLASTPELSGVIFFSEQSGDYQFTYFANPFATVRSRLYGDA